MMIRSHIAFPPETLRRMNALVGPKGRAAFVRKAVEQMLDAVETARKLEAEKAKRAK